MSKEKEKYNLMQIYEEVVKGNPKSNTGVLNATNTAKRNDIELSIDWCEITFPYTEVEKVLGVLNSSIDGVTRINRGWFGYDQTFIIDTNISVMINTMDHLREPSECLGVHLVMSGKGCRVFERQHSWFRLFSFAIAENANISRLDIALDSYSEKYFSTKKVLRAIKEGMLCSKLRRCTTYSKKNLSLLDGKAIGESVVLGSSKSKVQIIFYDKKLEQISKDVPVDEETIPLYRCEMRLRDELANDFVALVCSDWDNFSTVSGAVLYNYADFKIKSKLTQKSRMETRTWWKRTVGDVKKIKLSKAKIKSTIDEVGEWLKKYVARKFAMWVNSQVTEEKTVDDVLHEFYQYGLSRLYFGKK